MAQIVFFQWQTGNLDSMAAAPAGAGTTLPSSIWARGKRARPLAAAQPQVAAGGRFPAISLAPIQSSEPPSPRRSTRPRAEREAFGSYSCGGERAHGKRPSLAYRADGLQRSLSNRSAYVLQG